MTPSEPPRPTGAPPDRRAHPLRRRSRVTAAVPLGLSALLVMSTLAGGTAAASSTADEPEHPNAGIGYPVFGGEDHPVPPLPGGAVVGDQMRSAFEADVEAGAGTSTDQDFWVDDMLARYGDDGGFGDTNNWLFSRGRAAYMYAHSPGQLGFVGNPAYADATGLDSFFRVDVLVDGSQVALTEDVGARKQTPSYWTSTHVGGGVRIVQTKFITEADVAVALLEVTADDGDAHDVRLVATSPMAGTAEGDELTGALSAPRDLTELRPRLSGDGFGVDGGTLVRDVALPADGATTTKVQLGVVADEIEASRPEYDAYRAMAPQEAYTRHVTDYNRWWAEQIPYLDTPEDSIDKTLFYRWWLMRFNYLDADIPGNDYQFPTSMEGVLGYNNSIVLTAGMFIDDLKYLQDPSYSYGPWVSAGEVSRSSEYVDNPGDPANWSNSYTQYITEAAWRSYQLHGGPPAVAENLGRYGEEDVRGLLERFDGNGNDLIEYDWGALTGNDADAVSFDWAREHGEATMDRTESAYLYSNALAAAEAYDVAGRPADAREMRDLAQRVKTSVMDVLWNAEDDLLEHRQAGGPGLLVDWKEINNYYPFSVGLVPKPGDEDYDDDYTEALRLWQDADEFPIFPFYTANQADAAERGSGGSNNFSVINSTVTFRMLSSVLRDYPTDYLGAEDYKKLLYWNAWAHYIDGDNRLPDQNEFWAEGSANTSWGEEQDVGYRSWIHHTILGATNFTMIEDAMGLRPRSDAKVELDPVDVDWPYFRADGIPYRDRQLSVVWDEPGDGERPYGDDVPEGYSVYLDGDLAFTVDDLGRAVYDPATGTVETEEGVSVVTAASAELAAPQDVRFADDARVVDVMAKAGADVRTASTGAPDLAEGRPVAATYSSEDPWSSPEAAVDGSTVNEPFWGTVGSPNAEDALEVELDGEQTFDEVRVHFYRTSTSDAPQGGRTAGTRPGYAAPETFRVEARTDEGWQPVQGVAAEPAAPRANLNTLRFPPVTASAVRLVVAHHPGFATGVKEVLVRSTGLEAPPAENSAPVVSARTQGAVTGGSVDLRGRVRDDGLPAGELTSRWAVVEAPAGGTALFADPSTPSTRARVTEPGRYVLRLTGSDGERSTSTDVVVQVDEISAGGLDLAATGTPSASYTAGWNSVDAVNDGQAPTSGGDQQLVWGTWSGDRPASQWLQYTWDTPVRPASSELVFWSDSPQGTGQGVAVPDSWTVQYRAGDGSWVDLASGEGEDGGSADFPAVTTTALRAVLQASPAEDDSSYSAVAVSEWRVRADAPESVERVDVRTSVGELPDLPDQVDVVYADGTRQRTDVLWQEVTADQVASEGSFEVTGIVEGTALTATATVWVRATPPGQINTVDPVEVTTIAGNAPQLPGQVAVQYNDGSRELLPVTWADVDEGSYDEPGIFQVRGRVEGAGTTTAVATVTVVEGSGDPGTPPAPGTDVSLVEALTAASGQPDEDGTDHDVLVGTVSALLERSPDSPVGVLTQPDQPLTAFLPDDDAMLALADELLPGRTPPERVAGERLVRLLRPAVVEQLLLEHVVLGESLTAADVVATGGATLETAAGTELVVEVADDGTVTVREGQREAQVVVPDVNGAQVQVGHGVDAPLGPQ
ncbi:Ig-like domain-containing protein [Pseudokineococcus basanitobsidens]|uniref:Ig-like domain-containing protein n=1 Tax=Pseudokineococcus basanitobsidens TaxID=1926649 RepID=A0ABU8RFC2_9ACTN